MNKIWHACFSEELGLFWTQTSLCVRLEQKLLILAKWLGRFSGQLVEGQEWPCRQSYCQCIAITGGSCHKYKKKIRTTVLLHVFVATEHIFCCGKIFLSIAVPEYYITSLCVWRMCPAGFNPWVLLPSKLCLVFGSAFSGFYQFWAQFWGLHLISKVRCIWKLRCLPLHQLVF